MAGLLLKYGDYSFPRETTMAPMSAAFEFSQAGGARRRRETWKVTTVLTGANEAAMKTLIDDLETALLTQGSALVLYQTDGTTPTSHSLTAARILDIGYPEPVGPELAIRRTVEITFEGYTDIGTNNIMSFQESFSYSGGGARYVVIPTIEGVPQRFKVADQIPYRCVQRGSCTSRALPYPVPPVPRFPDALSEGMEPQYSTSRTEDGELRYITSWEYRFESPVRITGKPSTWGTEI